MIVRQLTLLVPNPIKQSCLHFGEKAKEKSGEEKRANPLRVRLTPFSDQPSLGPICEPSNSELVTMITRLLIASLVNLLALAPIEAAENVCAPDKMLKVVSRGIYACAPTTHFSRVPKTLYRYKSGYGRVEEAYNPESNLQLLIVTNEPHVWMANLASRTGVYVLDPGPTYYFRARLFGDAMVESALIRHLEFGCEIAWLKAAGAAERATKHPELKEAQGLEYSEGKEKVILYHRSGNPLRLELIRDGKVIFGLDYLVYEPDLKFEQKLFDKPAGIAFENAR